MRSARRALLAAATALALACALAPAQALAHGGNPNYRSEITSFDPPLPSGVSIEVLDYDSYLQLKDMQGHEVVLDGYRGEPYARIEKDGTVQVNERSPAYYLNDSRFQTDVTVPKSADPQAPPKWKTVDDSGTFIWHDHRMHWMIANQLPPQVKDKSQKTKIFTYEIPMTVDGTKTTLHGTLWWVGSTGTSKVPFIVAAIVIVLGGGALVLWLRRRRGGDDDGSGADDRPEPKEPAAEAW
jgi:LPXTG-motif cell wall-anchored protein